ncbi:hypothetical protein QJQ45_003277 [Haematococcus lacustris]|nr:hypothetical protein QJQ45_003277 [Haematococcus lacustris]
MASLHATRRLNTVWVVAAPSARVPFQSVQSSSSSGRRNPCARAVAGDEDEDAPTGKAGPHQNVAYQIVIVELTRHRATHVHQSKLLLFPTLLADPGKPTRVERLLANLGYGKRRECQQLVKQGRVLSGGQRVRVGDKVLQSEVTCDGEPLDPASPLVVLLHKPVGYVVTSPSDEGVADATVYDLLPHRYSQRRPMLTAVGRLDKDTSGLLILTDDGHLVQRIKSPRSAVFKVYEAKLNQPMTTAQAAAVAKRFASGSFTLTGDLSPLLPAKLTRLDDHCVTVAVCEGRYHQVRLPQCRLSYGYTVSTFQPPAVFLNQQKPVLVCSPGMQVRRMLAAVGHDVVRLHRSQVGGLTLGELAEGEWCSLTDSDLDLLFSSPVADQTTPQRCVSSAATSSPASLGTLLLAPHPCLLLGHGRLQAATAGAELGSTLATRLAPGSTTAQQEANGVSVATHSTHVGNREDHGWEQEAGQLVEESAEPAQAPRLQHELPTVKEEDRLRSYGDQATIDQQRIAIRRLRRVAAVKKLLPR